MLSATVSRTPTDCRPNYIENTLCVTLVQSLLAVNKVSRNETTSKVEHAYDFKTILLLNAKNCQNSSTQLKARSRQTWLIVWDTV